MPDLTENLIAFLATKMAAAFPSASVHVGEDIPQDITADYIWLRQAGEQMSDDLCDEVDQIRFDVEIICTDIATCRAWTAAVKAALRAEPSWSSAWGGLAQFASVDDHDDDYVVKSADSDEGLEAGLLAVTMHV